MASLMQAWVGCGVWWSVGRRNLIESSAHFIQVSEIKCLRKLRGGAVVKAIKSRHWSQVVR